MSRICGRKLERQQVRIGVPDRALTANAGLAVVSELCGRLGVIGALDAAVGPVKQRDRGLGAGQLLCGIAAAQLAGEDFLTGLDRQRADAAGQQITPVPGLAPATAAGLARRITPVQWQAVEAGLAVVTGRMMTLVSPQRAAALARAGAIYAYSFIVTNLDVSTPDKAAAVEHWYRHRTTVENIFRDGRHGAALRHLPPGYPRVNMAWMWGALLAATMAAWLHQLTTVTAGQDILAGHGVRGGKAIIATLRWRIIAIPGRLIRHARHPTLRLPPGHRLLPEILARLRELPARATRSLQTARRTTTSRWPAQRLPAPRILAPHAP